MEKIKILIVEDELSTAEDLADFVEEIGYQVMDAVSSAKEALSILNQMRPDLMLLDIGLGKGLDGINLAEMIRKKYDIPFIFIGKNIDKNTLEHLKSTESTAYLLKPFREKDLQASIEVTLYKYAQRNSIKENYLSPEIDKNDFWLKDDLFLKIKNQMVKIRLQDILWAEPFDNYTCLQTEKDKYLLSKTFKTVEEKLSVKGFLRVHHSYLVNTEKITSIDNHYLFLQKYKVPFNRANREELMSKMLVK